MKVTDLMVGDWVYNKHHKKNIQIQPYDFFVHGHGNNGTFAVSSTIVSGKDFVPIPLTEKILVKNGFDCQYYDDGNSYWWAVFDGWFNINFDHSDCSEGEFRCVNFRDLVIKSVHQLQHLLRLCGIEKEIEL